MLVASCLAAAVLCFLEAIEAGGAREGATLGACEALADPAFTDRFPKVGAALLGALLVLASDGA